MRNPLNIADTLLVSSPNGGGLALLAGDLCLPLLQADVTGLAVGQDGTGQADAVWCLQADGSRSLRELRAGQVRTVTLSEAPLDLHDVMLVGSDLYVVSTQDNEVLRYDRKFRLQERWGLDGAPDSSHLNSIAIHQGRLVASIFGRFSATRDYKGKTRGAGQVVDLRSGETLLDGLSQPHSLVSVGEHLYLCNSQDKELIVCDGFTPVRTVALPGYTRGLAIGVKHVYVGLSRSRNLEIDSATGYFETGSITILRRDDLEVLGAVPVPWKEVYDLRIVQDPGLTQALVAVCWEEERAGAAATLAQLQETKAAELAATRQAAAEARTAAAAKLTELQQAKAAELAAVRQAAETARSAASAKLTELQQAKAAELAATRQAAAEARTAAAAKLTELQQAKTAELAAVRQAAAEARTAAAAKLTELQQAKTAQLTALQQSLRQAAAEAQAFKGTIETLSGRIAGRDHQLLRLRTSHAGLAQLTIQRQRELDQAGERIAALQQGLSDERAAHRQRIDALVAASLQREDRIAALEAVAAQREAHAARLAALIGLRDGRIDELALALEQAQAHADTLEARGQALEARGQALERDLAIHAGRLHASMAELALVKGSRSWRLTRPLRFAMRLLRNRGLTGSDRDRVLARLRALSGVATGLQPGLPGVVPHASVPLPVLRHDPPAPASPAAQAAQARAKPERLVPAQVALAPQGDGLDDVFVWAVIDWHFRIQRPQHLARELAQSGRRVFYLSNNLIDAPDPGFRVEPLDDAGRLFQVFLQVAGKPVIYFDPPDAAAQCQLDAGLALLLQWTRSHRSLSLVQHPFWTQTARSLPNHRLVYDCMDHHGGFDNNGSQILALEDQLMRSADLLVASSAWLEEEGAKFNCSRALIRNAGQYQHFCQRPAEVFRDPAGRRVIGYYGAIAAWFDAGLVEAVARDNPDCLVLLVGADTCQARDRLRPCANVAFTGEVPYARLPYYLYGFDVCLLPFQVLPLTIATNPVKAYEYLGAGLPVVAVDLPEMRQFGDLVRIAADQPAFLEHVRQALQEANDDPLRQRRRDFAAGQTWTHRAQALLEAVAASAEPRVSVVVLTYNQLALTQACLASLEQHSDYPALEIIVVDNASTDGSPAWLRAWAGAADHRRLILNDDNRGFAAGNNQGLAAASGDYLVLLNNDTQVTPGWVRTLLGHLRRDPAIGIIGPVTNNIGNEARIQTAYADMDGMLAAAAAHTLRHPGRLREMRTLAFFCVMLPRAVYQRVGGLDEAFGIGFFEDDDYCRRVAQAGLRVVCAEDVFVHHHLSASFNTLPAGRKKALFDTNKAIYEAKWGEWTPHRYRDEAGA